MVDDLKEQVKRRKKGKHDKSLQTLSDVQETLQILKRKRGILVKWTDEQRSIIVERAMTASRSETIKFAKEKFDLDLPLSTLRGWLSKTKNHSTNLDGAFQYNSTLRGRPIEMPVAVEIQTTDRLRKFLSDGAHINFSLVKYVQPL